MPTLWLCSVEIHQVIGLLHPLICHTYKFKNTEPSLVTRPNIIEGLPSFQQSHLLYKCELRHICLTSCIQVLSFCANYIKFIRLKACVQVLCALEEELFILIFYFSFSSQLLLLLPLFLKLISLNYSELLGRFQIVVLLILIYTKLWIDLTLPCFFRFSGLSFTALSSFVLLHFILSHLILHFKLVEELFLLWQKLTLVLI